VYPFGWWTWTDETTQEYNSTTGQLTKVTYKSGASTYDANYYYDSAARLTKMTDWIDGTDGLRYAYDSNGRLTQLTDYGNRDWPNHDWRNRGCLGEIAAVSVKPSVCQR